MSNEPRRQTFDGDYRYVCAQCMTTIQDGDFYVIVHQYDDVDEDLRMTVHARCVGGMP